MSTSASVKQALRTLRYAHVLFRGVALLLLVLIVVNIYVLTGFRVEGHSMEPTLQSGQLVPVLRARYWFSRPAKGEIVIVQYAGDQHIRFVKRIEGVPGDTVEVQGKPVTLGPGEYYVLGDNRSRSTDSRVYGPIKLEQILGQVLGKQ